MFYLNGLKGGEDITITANFSNAAYVITYKGVDMVDATLGVNNGDKININVDGGNLAGTFYGASYPTGGNNIVVKADNEALGEPTKALNVFNGWELTDNGGGNYTFKATWLADKNDDKIADKNQIFVEYVTDGNGIITGKTEDVVAFVAGTQTTIPATTVKANDGYGLDYWTNDHDDQQNATGSFKLNGLTGGQTVTVKAHFVEAPYKINYKVLSGSNLVMTEKAVKFGDYVNLDANGGELQGNIYGDTVTGQPTWQNLRVNNNATLTDPKYDGFVFEGWTLTGAGTDTDPYLFKANWTADTNGDNIADKYQVFVVYVAGANGSVTPNEDPEVHTADKDASGNYKTVVSFTSKGASVTPDTGFALDTWSNDYDAYATTDTVQFNDVQCGRTITFTATFKAADYEISYNAPDTNGDGVLEPTVRGVADGEYALIDLDGGALTRKFYNADEGTKVKINGNETLEDPSKTDYVFAGWVVTGTGSDADPYKFTATWDADTNGDNIADKYQIFVVYESDATKGTVTPVEDPEVYTADKNLATGVYATTVSFETKGATAKAKTGYALENWTNDYNSATSKDGKFSFSDVELNQTTNEAKIVKVKANWAVDANNDGYPDNHQLIVNYVVDDTKIAEITGKTQEAFNAVQKDDGTYEDTVYVKTTGSTAKGKTASASMKYWQNSVNSERNQTGIFDLGRRSVTTPTITITAVFSKDSFGPDTNNDNKPDPNGVPDDSEVQIQLVDGLYGTISGQRFYTVSAKDDNGNYNEHVEAKFKLDPSVKVTPNKGYVFKGWKADVNPDKLYPANTTEFNFGTQLVGKLISIEPVFAQNHVAYVTGYPDGRFRPEKNITRAETATMIFRLFMQGEDSPISTNWNMFSDVDVSKWYNTEVSTMARAGYITGYPDGTFGGDKPITRAEFVTILVRFFSTRNTYVYFRDVSTNHWAYRYIATAAFNGWIVGYPDGTFKPDQPITRAEAVTVLNRLLGRGINSKSEIGDYKNFVDNTNPNMWYYYEIIEAANDHDAQGSRPNENWI